MLSDAGEAAERLAGALDAACLPYAIGGALAMGVHGYPSLDVGVNVFVEVDRGDDGRGRRARAAL